MSDHDFIILDEENTSEGEKSSRDAAGNEDKREVSTSGKSSENASEKNRYYFSIF